MDELAKLAARYKPNKILIEANFGDGMFTKLLQPHLMRHWPVSCEDIKNHAQKERRICDVLEPLLNSHRLVISQALVQKDYESTNAYLSEGACFYQLFYQLTHITRDRGSLRHDDRLDALAIACSYFAQAMAADTEKKVADARQSALDAELRKYMQHALGARPDGRMFATARTIS
jgi:hypothetical protein